MNEAFPTAAAVAQSIPPVLLLPEGKDASEGLLPSSHPRFGLFCRIPHFSALSFGSTIVTSALLSHNLHQHLRDAGGPISTLKVIWKAQKSPSKHSIGAISTLTCLRWSQCEASAQLGDVSEWLEQPDTTTCTTLGHKSMYTNFKCRRDRRPV